MDIIVSSLISIPKDMKFSLSRSTNYRDISLFNVMGKYFDYAILSIYNKCFQTSDMQVGFMQQHHSTLMCTLLYHEVISNIYSCLLDASNAFDRVHYGTMYITK